jgi:hypothetical protein
VDLGEAIWPLAPLREIVVGLVGELDGDALDLVLGSARSVLARLVPELGDERAGDPLVSSDRLCDLLVGIFKRLAQRDPLVVVVVEDLHWADATTRTLFSALARVGRIDPLLLVGTYRSDELHRRHPLRPVLAEIERGGRCERIDVRPLDHPPQARCHQPPRSRRHCHTTSSDTPVTPLDGPKVTATTAARPSPNRR